MTYLLDVNVLIALIDPYHIVHDEAHRWFSSEGHADWATCPLTENGVIRIVGHPKYPNTPGSPAAIAEIVSKFKKISGHSFWGDTVSLSDKDLVDTRQILTFAQVTDTYLLALAKSRGGKLVSFDRKLTTKAVAGGGSALLIIGQA